MGNFVLNPEIKQMLINFYQISGIRVGVHDMDQTIITDYPKQSSVFAERRFCEKNQGCSEKYRNDCARCDSEAFECARMLKKSYVYKCHLGFLEAVIPIMAGDEPFCFLVIGQVRCTDTPVSEEEIAGKIAELYEKYGIPEDKVPQAEAMQGYYAMPAMSSETFKSFVYFLELCAQKIYSDEYVRRKRISISEELIKYVKANLYNDVSIKSFSMGLGFSTSYVSHVIAREMNTTFTKYLLQCRMEEAKRLLHTTDMSVKRIALLLRFDDAPYFARQFKRSTGMTCTEFRNFRPF